MWAKDTDWETSASKRYLEPWAAPGGQGRGPLAAGGMGLCSGGKAGGCAAGIAEAVFRRR